LQLRGDIILEQLQAVVAIFRWRHCYGTLEAFVCVSLRNRPGGVRFLCDATDSLSRERDFLKTATLRILVADDYEPWRRFVSSTLQKQPELRVVGEVSDGLEAIQKAQELQPDLIVLDIGLPRLNGIEAARRIRERVPQSKILFFSENRSWDIVEEALRTGAAGYVVKWECASELRPAVEAVVRGKLFVSGCLTSGDADGRQSETSANLIPSNKAAGLPSPDAQPEHQHEVEFYADDKAFVDGFAAFIEANLRTGNAVIAVVTGSHRPRLLQKLVADGVDPEAAIKEGSLIPLDASQTVSAMMIDGMADPVHYAKAAGDLITSAANGATGGNSRVALCGEGTFTLLAEGHAEAAIQVEHLWDEAARRYAVPTLCGFLLSAFPSTQGNPIFERICAEHSAVSLR
jgi:DNA-binding NarL/FixJ family response regulator